MALKNIQSRFDNETAPAIIPTSQYISDWIERMLEDYKEEVSEDESWPVKLLRKSGRVAVWRLCDILNVEVYGIPGLACRLLERFLAIQLRNYISLPRDDGEWINFKESFSSRLPLMMVSCVQLAAKLSSARLQINARIIRAAVAFNGLLFSIRDINNYEFLVLKSLDFRIPLWTSVDAAEVLALEVGLPQHMFKTVSLFVNFAEFSRDKIDNQLRWAAKSSTTYTESGGRSVYLRTLHLAAGGVAAAARYLELRSDPAPTLARITRAPLSYIRCVSDILLKVVIPELDDVVHLKRVYMYYLNLHVSFEATAVNTIYSNWNPKIE